MDNEKQTAAAVALALDLAASGLDKDAVFAALEARFSQEESDLWVEVGLALCCAY